LRFIIEEWNATDDSNHAYRTGRAGYEKVLSLRGIVIVDITQYSFDAGACAEKADTPAEILVANSGEKPCS